MDFRQIFRTSKKDERITQLQGKITTLESDITWLKEQVAAKVERIDELKQQYEPALARYKELQERLDMAHEVETSQAEVIATQKQGIVDLEAALVTSFGHIDELKQDVAAQVERIRELEHDAAEYDVADDSFVQQIKDLQRDIYHLEADAAEHAIASQRYVKEIAESQGECQAFASENSDLIMFVRKCATGANIRADKPGGAKLVSDARALLKQYDSATVK